MNYFTEIAIAALRLKVILITRIFSLADILNMRSLWNRLITLQLIITVLFLFASGLKAKHIVGGEMYYNTLDRGSYEFHLILYRDCNSTGNLYDSQVNPNSNITGLVTVYRSDMLNTVYESVVLRAPDVNKLDILPPDVCEFEFFDLCIQRGEYVFDIDLPVSDHSYIVTYQRCCRNQTLDNIKAPLETGGTYTIEVTPTAQILERSSLRFSSTPHAVACLGDSFELNNQAIAPDSTLQTEIVHEFCPPLVGGGLGGSGSNPGSIRDPNGIAPNPALPPPYDEVVFAGGSFSASNPLGGSPLIQIDSETGLIQGDLRAQGQLLYAVCASEYDMNGNLISRVYRDYEINSIACAASFSPKILSDSIDSEGNFVLNTCYGGAFVVDRTRPAEFIRTRDWYFRGNKVDSSGSEFLEINDDIEPGEYKGKLIINQGDSCGADSANFIVRIHPTIATSISLDYDPCAMGEIIAEAEEFNPYEDTTLRRRWIVGDSIIEGETRIQIDSDNIGVGFLEYEIQTDNCSDYRSIRFENYPLPETYEIEKLISGNCLPINSVFTVTGDYVDLDKGYSYHWDFGDGTTIYNGSESESHTFLEEGTYDVKLVVENELDCRDTLLLSQDISAYEDAKASFIIASSQPFLLDDPVFFINQSRKAKNYDWRAGGAFFSSDFNTDYTFSEDGEYKIELIASNDGNCPDTAVQFVEIVRESSYFLPNAFRPESSRGNRLYRGQGYFSTISDFEMSIFNRWGEKVFFTADPNQGWNGRKNNRGPMLPAGVYICQVGYTNYLGKRINLREFVTLIR